MAATSRAPWRLGDAAVEIEPMRSYGGANPSGKEDLFTVSEALRMYGRRTLTPHPTTINSISRKTSQNTDYADQMPV
ncbi:hypothetical protein SGFS_001720 [Streptomyces graminofaciens]|uniref:Uncharacterized protein n=1 Tax=Streptomyces graminofaciens TaxID=68212 RepID=A0ABM7EZN9_9ACTN|nr:hypothetical protein SGFS_001720 [Streptomyces graminofaciens]